MYTFAPLPPINTLDQHGGLLAAFCLCLFIVLIAMSILEDSSVTVKSFAVIICFFLPLSYVTYKSFTTGEITERANVKVEAKLVGFVAEGYNESQGSGKHTKRVDVHNTYVVYEVDGTRTLFPASTGMSYPETAILYRN